MDDGVHPVDVEPIGQQEQKGIPPLADLGQGAAQFPEGIPRRPPQGLVALAIGLWHPEGHRQGEEGPPDGHAQKGRLHRLLRTGKAKAGGKQGHEDIQGKQQAAAQVAQGIAQGGHAVVIGGGGHSHQQGIIKDIAAGKAHQAAEIQGEGEAPVPLADELEAAGAQDPQGGKD